MSGITLRLLVFGAVLGLSGASLSAPAEEAAPPEAEFKDEPEAHALYGKMVETMRKAESLSYVSDYRTEMEDERIADMYRGRYAIWLKKPNYVRLEVTWQGQVVGILVGDGEFFWIHWPTGRAQYMKEGSPVGRHSIGHQTPRLGGKLGMTIINPSTFHGCTDSLQRYLDGVRSMGKEKVGDEECDVVEVSFLEHQRSWYLWLSKRDHLPRKLKQVIRVSHDIVSHERWSNVTINGEVPDEKFAWKPPEGWEEFRPRALEEGLLKVGTDAPDFELASADGSRIRLSDYRGKVVWLCIWRVGCPPCRKEIGFLQQQWERSKGAGLVVLGLNPSDDKQIALEFLRKKSVTFPNVLDTSEAARTTCFQSYQTLHGMSAVPLTYIIDREGKVAAAWYGFGGEDEAKLKEGLKLLERLGVK